jgi:molecular chaperone DnaK (HSP70)
MSHDAIVGIDLGTTNSEIAVLAQDRVQVLGRQGKPEMLPSCVGLSPSGELLVGEAARNQQLVYPERTVRGVKRLMGTDRKIQLGDREFSPPEISALILRTLAQWAEEAIGSAPRRAVITVPAYFNDAQRSATREAGELAGLDVVRVLNEPTAASLAFGGEKTQRTVLVYDLGGGTFDVSIVSIEDDVTEVLASHGNNELGGDDFNELLVTHLVDLFQTKHGVDIGEGGPAAMSRLWWAAEEAKKSLSQAPYAAVREEALVVKNGTPLHLETELRRDTYEGMIRPLLESTLESVAKAMEDAQKGPGDLDAVLLVGGATRTPLAAELLEQRTKLTPRRDVHPDLCVALGAGLLASRLGGHEVERLLVDVCPYSFGVSYLGTRGGVSYPYCYKPIIERNTPLPVTRTESYYTASPYQRAVEVEVFQGEDEDALKNILVGNFKIEGLTPVEEPNEILCRMHLDLDGILDVSAVEKRSGKTKHISIDQALQPKSEQELNAARERLDELFAARAVEQGSVFAESLDGDPSVIVADDDREEPDREEPDGTAHDAVRQLLARSREKLPAMHPDDQEEAIGLHEAIETAMATNDAAALTAMTSELKELLFFVEGGPA